MFLLERKQLVNMENKGTDSSLLMFLKKEEIKETKNCISLVLNIKESK